MKNLQKRHFQMQMRVAGDEKEPVLQGHAAVFNVLTNIWDNIWEKINPGAFAKALASDDIRALWNHDTGLVLGRNKAGTLELAEDKVGLAFTIRPPDTIWFRDRMISLKRGDVTGCSFMFTVDEENGGDQWETDPAGRKIRTILAIAKLYEVSPGVTFPAYEETDVALRSMQAWSSRLANSRQANSAVVQLEAKKRTLRLKALAS